MSQSSAWFPCYVNDLLGSIRWKTMKPEQRGAYWQLICWQMQSEDGHLPVDVATLSILADLDLSNANSCVLDAFPVDETCKRANVRALKEWVKRSDLSETRRALGKRGNDSRYGRASNCDSNSEALAIAIALAKPSPTTTTTTTTDTKTPTTRIKKEKTVVCSPEWLQKIDGYTDELWKAWLSVRKSKKATATEKAIQLTCERMFEQPHRGVEVLKAMVERNWISFQWDWLDKANSGQRNQSSGTSFAQQKPASYFRGKEKVDHGF